MSEKRSSVESQKAPKRETVLVSCATLPSMKSNDHAGEEKPVDAESAGRHNVDQHTDEREGVGVDAERHARADDRAQRPHAGLPDEPGNCHALL
jgi:hypothetical protein